MSHHWLLWDSNSITCCHRRFWSRTYTAYFYFRDPWQRLVSAYINKAVEYNYSRILHTPCKWERMKPYKADITFKQFLECIAHGSRDVHWTPQWKLCSFCSISYDYIGHLETVKNDAAQVLQHLDINLTYPQIFSSKMHKELSTWYADLPAKLLRQIFTLFKYDFLLHGYDSAPPGREDIFTDAS